MDEKTVSVEKQPAAWESEAQGATGCLSASAGQPPNVAKSTG
jgi:hypothetical protein